MIYPRYWIKHSIARRALRGYPLYDVPHKQSERTMTEAEAQENFHYFMSVRLIALVSVMAGRLRASVASIKPRVF